MVSLCALRKQSNHFEYTVFVRIDETANEFRITCEGTPPPGEPEIVSKLNMRLAKHCTTEDEAQKAFWEFVRYLEERGWVYSGQALPGNRSATA
jgi:hypothetical protein